MYTTCSQHVLSLEFSCTMWFNEQSVVILWVSGCKNSASDKYLSVPFNIHTFFTYLLSVNFTLEMFHAQSKNMKDVELNALRYTYCALNWCSNNLSLKPLGMMDWNTPPAPNQVRQAKKIGPKKSQSRSRLFEWEMKLKSPP